MKIKLSEQHAEAELPETNDALTLARVRKLALEKAGFAAQPVRRRPARRALIPLIAVLALMLLYATAVATDLGAHLADAFRDYNGPRAILDAIGLYGSAVGASATDQDITVRIEAAYANDAEGTLALSLDDAQRRLGDGMGFRYDLSPLPGLFNWDTDGGGSSSYFSATRSPDGSMNILLNYQYQRNMAGSMVDLTIDRIVPYVDERYDQPTGLTVAEILAADLPIPLPGAPEAHIVDARMEDGMLVLSGEYAPGPFRLNNFTLRRPDGTIIGSDRNQTFYDSEGPNRADFGFETQNLGALKDCELLYCWTREADPIQGEWKLSFQMPRGAGGAVQVPIDREVGLRGGWCFVDSAVLYPTCVTVDFSVNLSDRPEAANATFDDIDDRFPDISLKLNGSDQLIEIGSANIVSMDGDRLNYRSTIHCLTDQQSTIELQVIDTGKGAVIMTEKLK